MLICDHLVHLEEDLFSMDDEFTMWIDSLIAFQPYYKVYKPTLKYLYDIFSKEIFDEVDGMQKRGWLLIDLSRRIYLKNLQSVLEVFLNEIRKTDIAFGFYKKLETGEEKIDVPSFQGMDIASPTKVSN